jgi:pilus assembly protein CpaC
MNRSTSFKIAILMIALMSPVPKLQGASEQTGPETEVLHVSVGRSVVVNVQEPVTRVLSSNPAVVETVPTSPTQVVIEGKAVGSSSLILWDGEGHQEMLDVLVDLDVSGLRSAIQRAYPNQQLDVQVDGGRLILTGSVSDPHVVDDLGKMAATYSPQVVNSVKVAVSHDRQILLEVKFAEVDRTKLQEFGVNIFSTGATNTIGSLSTQQFGPPTITGSVTGTIGSPLHGTSTSFSFTNLLNIFLFRPDINLGASIQDLEQKSILQILAEPNLLSLSGQKASFLAGGEFPFPVVQGGQNIGAVTIQFRPFGVKLDFLGYAQADNTIRLHVLPEVSTLDFSNAVTISGFTVPALSTRRAETEIELKDGQSFGIAGLLDNRATVQLSKVPGIGDIPVLGELFRSRSVNRSNTELLVLVTPHLVDPIAAAAPPAAPPALSVPFMQQQQFDQNVPSHNKVEAPNSTANPK